MKIVRIIGGLGNQMFQYALYIALKKKFPEEEILVDTSLFRGYNVHNGLELERVFGIELPQASFMQLIKLTKPTYNYNISRITDNFLPSRKTELYDNSRPDLKRLIFSAGDRYYAGYWLDYRYTLDALSDIRNAYRFKLKINDLTLKVLEKIESSLSSVSIHIRRGDYLKVSNYAGLCGVKYYEDAIRYIINNVDAPEFYVFSDDLDWCKFNLTKFLSGFRTKYVDWNKGTDSPLDMMLMSKCKHNIIANSSFSWWAATLNRNDCKIVCAPQIWTNNPSYCIFQRPEWILL